MYSTALLAHPAPLETPSDQGDLDAVTGLPGRHAFLQAADRLRSGHGTVAMVVLDIDRFTELNEQHGLRVGDHVLRQMALRCLRAITAHGGWSVLGRVGPDEFALAWTSDNPTHVSETDQIQGAADAVRRAACGVYELGAARNLVIDVSVGVSLLADPEQEAADALLHASAARQSAQSGCGVVHYAQLDSHRRLVRALREDILADRINVAWQPKVDLATGRLVGLEALARWNGPDGQPVPPSVFIPMAERNGLIAELGNRITERVLRELAAWRTEGLQPVPVAINVSAPQFQRPDMAARLQSALLRHHLPPSLIEIELTESILTNDFASTLATLHALRAVGVGLSIDDFGTGYSSLAYLRCFPVQSLKLDRSFVSDLGHDARTREIVDAVIALAHKFDVRCIAEGVESVEQAEVLRQMGCDQVQGYLFDRPLSALEVRARLTAGYRWN